MSMVTELFGIDIINVSLTELKLRMKELPPIWSERLSYILHDWARITGVKLQHKDFTDVGALPQTK